MLTPPDAAESWSSWTSVANAIAGIIAMIVAGFWTYNLFVKRRQTKPRAELAQDVCVHRLPNGKLLVHIELRVKNIGEVLLEIRGVRTRILQVLPFTDDLRDGLDAGFDPTIKDDEPEIRWATLQEWDRSFDARDHPCQIEPGETDELHFDAIVEADITRLQVHSHVRNFDVRGVAIGWRRTTHHDAPAAPDGRERSQCDDNTTA